MAVERSNKPWRPRPAHAGREPSSTGAEALMGETSPHHRRLGLHRPAPRPGAARARRPGARPRQPDRAGPSRPHAARPSSTPAVELDRRRHPRRRPRCARALDGVDAVVHLAAEVGVGQSMYAVDRYTSVNDYGTAVLFQALIDQPVRRVVVASSMSIYGEGLYRTADGALVEDVVRGGRNARRRLGPARRRGPAARPGADAREQAPGAALGLRHRQVRAGAPDPDPHPPVRHGGRGAAALEHLRARPGALEPLHRRARDLRLAHRQRPAADGLRGRPAAPRLRPRPRRRPRLPARARPRRRPTARSSTSARARTAPSRRWRCCRPPRWAAPTSRPRSPARPAPATSATTSPTSPRPAPSSATAPRESFAAGLAELAEWVARQEATDRVAEARGELERRGLVA